MRHALIISADPDLASVIEDRLLALGFRAFERSWTEDDAVDAARQRPPDLIVVGDCLEAGSSVQAAGRINEEQPDIPVLLATTCLPKLLRELPQGASLSGPYSPDQAAVAVKRSLIRLVAGG